jgi:hypothetical protein
MSVDRKLGESEKPFAQCKVYFSNSIQGVLNQDPEFGWNIVQYLSLNGAQVLDKHVGGRNEEERNAIFKEELGFDYNEKENPKASLEQADIGLVDGATHIIAFINGPSHGVGNEIQRAIDRYEFKDEDVQILCLVSSERADKLSWMISGKEAPKYPIFHLKTYKDIEEAKTHIFEFLTER